MSALIVGITGQDGYYLTKQLIEEGVHVFGIVRRHSNNSLGHLKPFLGQIKLFYGDLVDPLSLSEALHAAIPVQGVLEVYHLGAQSHVKVSFENPVYTSQVNALGTLNLLELIRGLPRETQKRIRLYNAGTSELFGKVLEIPQKETTPFNPQSPYAIAKRFSLDMVRLYREAYDLFAVNGILFNHESPKRGATFVTQKIVRGLKQIWEEKGEPLRLGNLNAQRDWSHAEDAVRAMTLMIRASKPQDYVVSSGVSCSVRRFCEMVWNRLSGSVIEWKGEGDSEKGYDDVTSRLIIQVDPDYFRPAEVEQLLGDSTKIRQELGWSPRYNLSQLIDNMLE